MKSRALRAYLLLGSGLAAMGLWKAMPGHGASATPIMSWNSQSAAHYLDDREAWWQSWPPAQKDRGTICISCHTVVPYAMARPGLRQELGETAMSKTEKTMMDSVETRVSHWSEIMPFYSDAKNGPGKTSESHATEAVLNAVILASYDERQGHLRPITRSAFDEVWELQEKSGDKAGGWKWQDFHLSPWESAESGYQGAALLMLAAVNAPDGFAQESDARRHLDLERDYLRRHYAEQPLMNQLYILWTSAKEPGLLKDSERKTLLVAVRGQQQADGGWRTITMDKNDWIDHPVEPIASDGYATGLALLAMKASGINPHDKAFKRGLEWLAEHQEKDGSWSASSLNKKRAPESDAYLFMSDAATAYAVLALEKVR